MNTHFPSNDQIIQKLKAEITRLKDANDQLFLIKQKVVIANRELMEKNRALTNENEKLRALYLKAIRSEDASGEPS
jgi:hypothetical protein